MKFVKITENEHTKVMLDLEGLNLPEMAVAAEDVTRNITNDNKRNYRFVNEFLATLTDDRAAILATGLINMQRAVNKHEDVKECVNEFNDVLISLTQNPVLNLVGALRTFSHNNYVDHRSSSEIIWHKSTEEMITAASLLSALCAIPLNHLLRRRDENGNSCRISEIALLFENAIKNSGSDGERFVNYIRNIVDTVLVEKANKPSKNMMTRLIYVNQFATNEDILDIGVAEYVICRFSKHVLSSYVLDKWVDRTKLERAEKEAQQVLSKHTMLKK